MSRTVLILGAGFSRAISELSPLTDELGTRVLARLDRSPPSRRPFEGGSFEMWLSRLAVDQPDLSSADNQENRALFSRVATAVHEVLVDAEFEILRSSTPDWLARLLGLAHRDLATFITFNYDTLVERAVMTHLLFDWTNQKRATYLHVINETPPLPAAPARWAGGDHPTTFRLLKLHGSLDYFWVPNDTSGATINRWDLAGSWGVPTPPDTARRDRYLPGREPFIVPPSAAKSTFYDNPITRQAWRSAAEALREADRVVLAGYSLPATDMVTTGMLTDHIRPSTEILVADVNPGPIVDRLDRLIGLSATPIEGTVPIRSFVEHWAQDAACSVVEAVFESIGDDDHAPVVVAWGGVLGAPVASARRTGTSEVELLVVDPLRPVEAGLNAHRQGSALPPPLTGKGLLRMLRPDDSSISVAFESAGIAGRIVTAVAPSHHGIADAGVILVPAIAPPPMP